MAAFFILCGIFIVILSSLIRYSYLYTTNGKPSTNKRTSPCKTIIVVGAGGHSMEMMNLLSGLNSHNYTPRIYIVAKNDSMSKKKIQAYESTLNNQDNQLTIWGIMRAREVGQSYISSVFTTILGFVNSLPLILKSQPDIILCNGPGTCIPVCLAGYIFKYFGLTRTRVVYVESVCRTEDLSLSAKILYHLAMADDVIVQWPQLVDKYPKVKYLGRLI